MFQANTHLEPLRLKVLIEQFIASYNIFPCGIDTRRYVVMKHSRNWMMIHEGFGFFPRPWSLSNGDINCSILRFGLKILIYPFFGFLKVDGRGASGNDP